MRGFGGWLLKDATLVYSFWEKKPWNLKFWGGCKGAMLDHATERKE
jgi:hypothetical protein